jgi:outer membrane murein-binding lipoprotein Lpp
MQPHEVTAMIVGILTIISLLLGGLGWWINTKIKAATYQIQPNTNGGVSLRDLHKKIDSICEDIQLLKTAVVQLENDVSHLEDEVGDLHD